MSAVPIDVHQSLQSPVSDELKRHILDKCWSKKLSTVEYSEVSETYNPYFHHYQTVCQNCSTDDVGRLTHRHLLEAFDRIKIDSFDDCVLGLTSFLTKLSDPYLNRGDVRTFVIRWILHTAHALLLLDLSEWKGTDTLEQYLVNDQFATSVQDDSYRIPVSLNLRTLQKIGGLHIRWTSKLSEHLSLEKEDTQLAVFHHASILDLLESSGLYPKGITNEVRLTFGMLLPRDDAKSRKWFKAQVINPSRRAPGSSSLLDPAFECGRGLKPGDRNIRRLDYLRDRMISVKDLYDSHEPQTFMQSCRDSRRPARRWAFFIAILVFLFGTGQLIEGAIQCYKSYH